MKKIIMMIVFLVVISGCSSETKNDQVINTKVKIVKENGILSQEGSLVEKQTIKEETVDKDKEDKPNQGKNKTVIKVEDNNKNTNEIKQDEQMMAINIAIDCKTILNNLDKLDSGYKETGIIPEDGMILKPISLKIKKTSTVLDVLEKVNDKYDLALKIKKSPYGTYIISIKGVAEKICGMSSGWMYSVNGIYPGESVSSYQLKDGDIVKLNYTCQPGDLK